jgi:hypothetical protein
MRVALFAWVLLAVLQLPAQQTSTAHPTVSKVLEQMKSPSRTEREKAFGEAGELLGSAATSAQDGDHLRLAIIQLLVRENNGGREEADQKIKKGPAPSDGAGDSDAVEYEEESDYYSGLIGFVAGLNDERAIPALLGAANTGGIATRGVARFGERALNPTLEQVRDPNADLAEGAVWVIRDILEFRLVSDPESHLRIKNALRSALGSQEFGLRGSAMGAIEYLDDREEFVPMLKEVAEHDPVKLAGQRPDDGGDNGEFYPARFDARRLLRKIANHEPPVVDKGLPPEEYLPVKP